MTIPSVSAADIFSLENLKKGQKVLKIAAHWAFPFCTSPFQPHDLNAWLWLCALPSLASYAMEKCVN